MGCKQGKASEPLPPTAKGSESADASKTPFLLGSQQELVKSTTRHATCPSGHLLHHRISPKYGSSCHSCRKVLSNDQMVWSCHLCSLDNPCANVLCDSCVSSACGTENSQALPVNGSQPSGTHPSAQPSEEACLECDGKCFKVGARVVATTDIRYSPDHCVHTGTQGTIDSVLHRYLWVKWDIHMPVDNAVVLASQVDLVEKHDSSHQKASVEGASQPQESLPATKDVTSKHKEPGSKSDPGTPIGQAKPVALSESERRAEALKQIALQSTQAHVRNLGAAPSSARDAEKSGNPDPLDAKSTGTAKTETAPARKEKNMCCCC